MYARNARGYAKCIYCLRKCQSNAHFYVYVTKLIAIVTE